MSGLRILKPIIGGDAHHRRVAALRTISEADTLTYQRYDRRPDTADEHRYIVTEPRVGDIELVKAEAELFAAGYAMGLINLFRPMREVLGGLLGTPLPPEPNLAYYGTPTRGRSNLICYTLGDDRQLLMRRDHAATFLAAYATALTTPATITASNTISGQVLVTLTDLYQQLTAPPRNR